MSETRIKWWEPRLTGAEGGLLEQVLDSNFLNDGEVTARFEEAIARSAGARFAVAVTSGTSALFAALKALGVGAGDEVIVPDITFVASANAVTWAGATPVPVDVDPTTLNMDAECVRAAITPRTRAVMPVHVSGRSADMERIMAIAGEHDLRVVEDAAEALGSRRGGRPLGTIGDAGCISLSPNKTITTGQGGIVLTNDEAVRRRLAEIKDQGRPVRGTGGDDTHVSVGFNLKFTNLQAAVGLAQLQVLEQRTARLQDIYRAYAEGLRGLEEVRLPGFDVDGGEVPQWVDAECEDRDGLETHLRDRGMDCRRFWHPVHAQPPYRQPDERFPVSSRLVPRCLWFPSAFTMSDEQVAEVCAAVRGYYRAN